MESQDTIYRVQNGPRVLLGGLTNLLKEIEAQAWAVDHALAEPRHYAVFRRQTAIRRAGATTRIEGFELNDEAVARLAGQTRPATDQERANLNAINAYEFVNFLSEQKDLPIDELVIRELNRLFLEGFPRHNPGSYRTVPVHVGLSTPPGSADLAGLMGDFAGWLRGADELHPVVRAALAHLHLVAIHPFRDGNGRTARALATLILQRWQYSFRQLLALDPVLEDRKEDYFESIERSAGRTLRQNYDATYFAVFFVLATREAGRRVIEELTNWRTVLDESRKLMMEGLSRRQTEIVALARLRGSVSRNEAIALTGASSATTTRDLSGLARRGHLQAQGATRTRVYLPVQSSV